MKYIDELKSAMTWLSKLDRTVFIGQSIEFPGTGMYQTFSEVPPAKKLEMPVEEDFQLGLSIGMALAGMTPISVFPRWNFLLLATNQLVNHLDKMRELLGGKEPPKVIVRTAIGSVNPLHPGPQHVGDFTEAFKLLLPNVEIVKLEKKEQIVFEYQRAAQRADGVSTILVEWSDNYDQ